MKLSRNTAKIVPKMNAGRHKSQDRSPNVGAEKNHGDKKKPRSLQREPRPGARGDLTLGTIYCKGYKMIFSQSMPIKNGCVPPGGPPGMRLAVELAQIHITAHPLARTARENRLHRASLKEKRPWKRYRTSRNSSWPRNCLPCASPVHKALRGPPGRRWALSY
jgi:hypothetical protein